MPSSRSRGNLYARNHPQYDVTPDGQRFEMIRENVATPVVYVENWFAELLAKAKPQWCWRTARSERDRLTA